MQESSIAHEFKIVTNPRFQNIHIASLLSEIPLLHFLGCSYLRAGIELPKYPIGNIQQFLKEGALILLKEHQ